MSSGHTDDSPSSLWASLGLVDQAREWEEFKPGTFEVLFNYIKQQAEDRHVETRLQTRHEMRMDYIAVGLQLLALVFGMTAVVIVALTAKYYLDHNAASQGARIFGFGAGSIVAAFLGVNASPVVKRVTNRRKRAKG